jgi:hypothetical protein
MRAEVSARGATRGALEALGLGVWGAALGRHALIALGDEARWPYLIVALATLYLVVGVEGRHPADVRKWTHGRHGARVTGLILLAALVLLALGLVAHQALRGDFLAEDFGLVDLWHRKDFAAFWRLGDVSGGVWGEALDEWRPLWAVTYRLDHQVFGRGALGPHVTNLALHGLNGILVGLIVLVVCPSARPTAILGALLFAVAPVNAEPICWITGRVDSVATVFYLAAFLFFALYRGRGALPWYGLCVGTMALGLLAKETLLTFPLAAAAHDLFFPRGRAGSPNPGGAGGPRRPLEEALAYVPLALVGLAYVGLRSWAFGRGLRGDRLSLAGLRRFVSEDYRLGYLLAPFDGVAGWPGRTPAASDDLQPLLTALVVGMVLGLLLLLFRARHRDGPAVSGVLCFGLLWHLITTLPLLVTYPSARHLYLPSAGFAIALAIVILPGASGGTRPTALRIAAALAFFLVDSATLVKYCGEWAAAGEVSRRVREGVEGVAARALPGSIFVISRLPGSSNYDPIRIWKWALPYALRPPAAKTDVYSRVRVVEAPEDYCCPVESWWERRRKLFADLSGPQGEDVTLLAFRWDAAAARLSCVRATVPRGRLAAALGSVLPAARARLNEQTAGRLVETLVAEAESAGGEACPGLRRPPVRSGGPQGNRRFGTYSSRQRPTSPLRASAGDSQRRTRR